MRLALVVERFEPAGGGVERAVWETAHALAEAGDDVTVLARSGSATPRVRFETVRAPRAWQPLRIAVFAAQVARALREAPPFDAVHAFCRSPGADCFHAGGGSHAHYMERTYGDIGAALRRVSPRHAMQLELERRVFAERPWVQCVSAQVARELRSRYAIDEARLRIIPYGVDSEVFRPADASERTRLRSQIEAGSDAATRGGARWLFAGSGWRRKGLDTALAALALARDADSALWVAGKDDPAPWRRRARTLGIDRRVRFLGPRDDLPAVFRASDGLLLPTRYDAFGMVCLEAAASGVPVVTSRAAGASEFLGGAAEIVDDAEDVRGFADALDALSDPRARETLGAEGRRIAARSSWRDRSEDLRGLYAEIAAAHASGRERGDVS